VLVQGVDFEASTLGTTYNIRTLKQNLQRTEANTYIPFRFLSVDLKYHYTESIFIFRVLHNIF